MAERATVLICDDDDGLRELMRVTLEPHFDCIEAIDADSALEQLRASTPAAALLDVMLPGRSGLDVLREMRADPALAEIPVIVVSAWTRDTDRTAASEAGADAFLGKPFEIEELTDTVTELIGRRR